MQPKGQAGKSILTSGVLEVKELEAQGSAQAKEERGDTDEMKDQPWRVLSKHVLAGTLRVALELRYIGFVKEGCARGGLERLRFSTAGRGKGLKISQVHDSQAWI